MAESIPPARAALLLADAGLVDPVYDPDAVARDLEARLDLDRSLDALIGADDA